MKYIVIGLGNLGKAIAENLAHIGNDVIGVDLSMNKVDAVKQSISGAICLDTTDSEALGSLPIKDNDAIIVTYGKDFGASVQTVALLKSLGADKIIVRSISPIHETVIRSIGVSKIITPESDYAVNYASQSLLGGLFNAWYKVTDSYHLFKIITPSAFVGQSLASISIEENFNLKLVAIERMTEGKNLLGIKQMISTVIDKPAPTLQIEKNDILIIFGQMDNLHKIAKI